jgi:hypothetical protein
LDPARQLSDPYSGYKFPFSYAFISGDGNEGQYRPLKGVAFGDSDNKYTSRFKLDGEVGDTEYTLSREGEFQFLDGNIGLGYPITRGNVDAGDPLASFEIIFTGAAEATGIGILGASVPSVTPIYGDTTTQVVNVDEVANIVITNVGENIDTFSPLIVGDIQGSVGVGITYDGMHPKVTGAAVIYNATGYTKSVYDWALFSGDVNERGFKTFPWIDTDAKREHPKGIDGTKASYLNSFTNTYLTNGESLHFRLKNKFYADTDESKVTLVFSGIPTGDDIVVKALNEKGEEKEVHLGKVRISEESQLRDHTVYNMSDETKVIEVEVTGGASIGADGQFTLQDHTRIRENISLQVSGDSLDYFTTYPYHLVNVDTEDLKIVDEPLHYYNEKFIGNTIPWDPKYADSAHLTPRRII